MAAALDLVHATAIAVSGRAVLIRGPSGSGKSDLALRCLAMPTSALLPEQATLVADDQVLVGLAEGRLVARPPPAIAGRIEVRGLGIRSVPYSHEAVVVLLADLVAREAVERLPDPWPHGALCGVGLPLLRICAFDASAPVKLMLALSDTGRQPM